MCMRYTFIYARTRFGFLLSGMETCTHNMRLCVRCKRKHFSHPLITGRVREGYTQPASELSDEVKWKKGWFQIQMGNLIKHTTHSHTHTGRPKPVTAAKRREHTKNCFAERMKNEPRSQFAPKVNFHKKIPPTIVFPYQRKIIIMFRRTGTHDIFTYSSLTCNDSINPIVQIRQEFSFSALKYFTYPYTSHVYRKVSLWFILH